MSEKTVRIPLLPLVAPPPKLVPGPSGRWKGPTFAEFLAEVEHEFGSSVDTASLFLAGIDRGERLTAAEVKALCGQLGLPAEDFGV